MSWLKRLPAFAVGHVGGALLIGAGIGGLLIVDWSAVWEIGGTMAGGALVSALVCWWRPGYAGAWWKLWLVATFANPLFLTALYWTWSDRECLLGHRTGWNCLLSDLGPDTVGFCLVPPILGLLSNWGWRRFRKT
jgi:hypothetical protein